VGHTKNFLQNFDGKTATLKILRTQWEDNNRFILTK